MKIIFIKDVKGQGKKDDIKEVKNGYGEFLIKSGAAVVYSPKSVEILNHEIDVREKNEEKIKNEAIELKKKIERVKLSFKVKTGAKDKVFGNITSSKIEAELKSKGFNIDKKKIEMDLPLNALGNYKISIKLHKSVNAEINVELVK